MQIAKSLFQAENFYSLNEEVAAAAAAATAAQQDQNTQVRNNFQF